MISAYSLHRRRKIGSFYLEKNFSPLLEDALEASDDVLAQKIGIRNY